MAYFLGVGGLLGALLLGEGFYVRAYFLRSAYFDSLLGEDLPARIV